ncbi:hypothetical protein BABINDRAFT_17785, partial [Babjeviella inositovora NRRL Y-12698]
ARDFQFRINWLYRPRDIPRDSADSRMLYITMHSDVCPLSTFRGKVVVRHRDEVGVLDDYRARPNHFYFNKLFDRYMVRFYEVLCVALLEPRLTPNYFAALHKRFPYVFMETTTASAESILAKMMHLNCEVCHQWLGAAEDDTNALVSCTQCDKHFHMLCLDPPLARKPSKGFGWYCVGCTRKYHEEQELTETRSFEESFVKDSSEERASDPETTKEEQPSAVMPYQEMIAARFLARDAGVSFAARRDLEEWPYHYLGLHANIIDIIHPDHQSVDNPYPRAKSRLSVAKHQASVEDWEGHHEVYYDVEDAAPDSKKKKVDAKKKKSPLAEKKGDQKDTEAHSALFHRLAVPDEYRDTDPADYPAWLKPRPHGYVERGGDVTAELLWTSPAEYCAPRGEGLADFENPRDSIEEYLRACSPHAARLDVLVTSPNFMDACLKAYLDSGYQRGPALAVVARLTRARLKEPTFSKKEVEKFEGAVAEFGSELFDVHRAVGSQSMGMVVRFYYMWKKCPNGRRIWG